MVDVLEHSKIEVHFEKRWSSSPQEVTESMWAESRTPWSRKDSKYKLEDILLLVDVCKKEHIEGKVEPERIALELSPAGTGVGATEPSRRLFRDMQ